jgi:hypothetical protein
MIIETCPYDDCKGRLWVACAETTPAFERHDCETCARPIWTRHSRIDPWSMTEADFLEAYTVNDETRRIAPTEKTLQQERVDRAGLAVANKFRAESQAGLLGDANIAMSKALSVQPDSGSTAADGGDAGGRHDQRDEDPPA